MLRKLSLEGRSVLAEGVLSQRGVHACNHRSHTHRCLHEMVCSSQGLQRVHGGRRGDGQPEESSLLSVGQMGRVGSHHVPSLLKGEAESKTSVELLATKLFFC